MNTPKIIVIARLKRLADQFMRHCLLTPDQWTFAYQPESLMGLEGCVIMQLGPMPGETDDERDYWFRVLEGRGWPRNVVMRLPA